MASTTLSSRSPGSSRTTAKRFFFGPGGSRPYCLLRLAFRSFSVFWMSSI